MLKGFFEDTEIYQAHYLDDVPWPTLAMVETSSACNLRCPHCPRTMGKSPSGGVFGNMKLDMLDRLDDVFKHANSVVLSWFGEPLINKDLPEIVRRLKGYGLHTHVTTNAMFLTETMAEALIRAGLDAMAISMDAADPETFSRLRPGADLDKIKANIQNLNALKRRLGSNTPQLQAAIVVMDTNVAQLPDMIRLVDELEIRQFTIGALDDFGLTEDYALAQEDSIGPQERARQAFAEAKKLAAERGIQIGLESPARFYHEIGEAPAEFAIEDRFFRNDYTAEERADMGLRKGCGVPWAHTVISHEGNVHPCCVSTRVLGNIYEQSFEEVWRGEAFREFRTALKSTNPPTECRNCRRAIWNGSHGMDELDDHMQVWESEVHGQGWGGAARDPLGHPYRHMERDSTFFLRNGDHSHLAIELGTFQPNIIDGRVEVNNVEAGRFRIRPGWHQFDFALPGDHLAGKQDEVVKVKVISDPPSGHLLVREARLLHQDERKWWNKAREAPTLRRPLEWLSIPAWHVALRLNNLVRKVR